jgi:murein DD-endopeptidase MepM/ murein hydrolase activator NlpD
MNIKKIFRRIALVLLCLAVIAIILDFKISKLPISLQIKQRAFEIQRIYIVPGDTIDSALSRSNLPSQNREIILNELKKEMNVNRCKPNDFYELRFYKDSGDWFSFSYYPADSDQFYLVKKNADGSVYSNTQKLGVRTVQLKKEGAIESSLWEAMIAQNIPPEVILSFVEIFEWQMDFNTDTQKSDEFRIIFQENIVDKKNTISSVLIKSAQYKSAKKTLNAVYFVSADGKRNGYFDLEGNSVKRMFLSAPLQYRRISSYFSKARLHPILRYVRPHLGIDYAAPEGTPVSAIADGVITQAQRDKSLGNFIRIRHSNGYETTYGHLRNFAEGIRAGRTVKQGELIGYVGKTGLATGPHLDFRIKQHGKSLDFLAIKQPPTTTLTQADRPAFDEIVKQLKFN